MTIHVPSFRYDGSVMDLAAPTVADVDWADFAGRLSRIIRFNGARGALSVAQHSIMGADALFKDKGDCLLAGYFLLHDVHEAPLGDWTRPAVDVLHHTHLQAMKTYTAARLAPSVKAAMELVKSNFDLVIYKAAGVPDITLMPDYHRQIKEMDNRMLRAEALAIFGPAAAPHLPAQHLPPPRTVGGLLPWGAGKAEEAFLERLDRYLNIVVRLR